MNRRKLLMGLALLAGLFLLITGCARPGEVDGYVAVVPQVLYSGEPGAVSLSLFSRERLARGEVKVALLREGREMAAGQSTVWGKGRVSFSIPQLEPGQYELSVTGPGFADKAMVRVEDSRLLFVETDKPIYKPGQTIHIRVLTLNSELRPLPAEVVVEAMDAKGIKVFRRQAATDEYGMAWLELPLSAEPNLGVWKLTASSGKKKAQLEVRVEKYVLPKYEVKLELPKEWYLVDEPVKGEVTAEYSFGKPVAGEVEIIASRYVGRWQQYASFSGPVAAGRAEFELPAPRYVAGVPAARGMGNVMLEVTVTEKATGYEEKTSRLLTVASAPLSLQIIPEAPLFKPSLPFRFLIVTETPDNRPQDAPVQLTITYFDREFPDRESQQRKELAVATEQGKALITITPPQDSIALMLQATSGKSQTSKVVQAGYSPSANFIHLEQVTEGIPQVGGKISFEVYSTAEASNFYYEVVSRGKVVFADYTRSRVISFPTTPVMAPVSRLLVYQVLPNSEVAADYLPFSVAAQYPHQVEVAFSQPEAAPGEEVAVLVSTEGKARVGIETVDRSVFILAEKRLNLQQLFAELERLYMQPQAEIHSLSPYSPIAVKGARETFADAGVVVLSNKKVPQGKEYGRRLPRPVPAPMPAALRAVAGKAGPAGPESAAADLAEVKRVRQFFPETWLWREMLTDATGQGRLQVTVPDSITTWKLRAVALSPEHGLGIAESELRAFQPFFLSVDLPYAATRGRSSRCG